MEKADNENLMDVYLGSVANFYTSPFSAENTALFQTGIFINISENTVLKKPIQLKQCYGST